jgi:N-acetylglucosaminyl-diphospho-decaprenol L-rhamnosyltransferase
MVNIQREILISVVSHSQGEMVKKLLDSIENNCRNDNLAVILTLNVPERLYFDEADYSFPINIHRNKQPKGFGTNHNQAYAAAANSYFCVLNPDVWFGADPFPGLKKSLEKGKDLGIIAPAVYNSKGELEDSARQLPTPLRLLKRQFSRRNDYAEVEGTVAVDWVAGMFMLFRADFFEQLNGFDERYYLYCEDIDICSRAWLAGRQVLWNKEITVRHDARHSSHKELSYFWMHLTSMLRLFTARAYYRRLYQKYVDRNFF